MSGPNEKQTAMAYAVLRAGGSVASVAAAIRVHPRTVWKWLDSPHDAANYEDFRAEYARARAEYRDQLVTCIVAAAPEDWKAAAWLLERQHSREFSRSIKIQVQEQIHEAVSKVREVLGDEIGEKVLRVFAEQEREEPTRAPATEH